jgi:hypothetical protein
MCERSRPWRARRTLCAALLVLLAVAAPGAATGQTPVSPPPDGGDASPVRFFLEEIRVEGARPASGELVRAEARLETGRAYSEEELRRAVQRVVRLPLVVAAEPRLEKGSRRGRYVLVLSIEEANPWFFNLDLHYQRWRPDVTLPTFYDSQWVDAGSLLMGYRRAIGRRGVGFVALSGADGTLNLGYTLHDVGRRGILVSGSVAYGACWIDTGGGVGPGAGGEDACQTQVFDLGLDPTVAAWSLDEQVLRGRLQVGVPLTGNHSLRFLATSRDGKGGQRSPTFEPRRAFFTAQDRRDRQLSAAWVFDSTDDPVFPTRGLRAEVGVETATLEARLRGYELGPSRRILESDFDSRRTGAVLGAEVFRTFGDDTLSLRGRAFVGRSDLDGVPTEDLRVLSGSTDTWSAEVAVAHSRLLWQRRQPQSWRELRWENVVEVSQQGTSPDFGLPFDPLTGLRVGTALRLRTNWGLFSLRFDYLDYDVLGSGS